MIAWSTGAAAIGSGRHRSHGTQKRKAETMAQKVKIAGIQMAPKIGEKAANLRNCLELMGQATGEGATLVVFPECALTGYCFSSLEEALGAAEPVPGPATEEVSALCRERNAYAVLGLLEEDAGACFNAVVLVGPHGVVGKYRKLHLPCLGVDRFTRPGDIPPAVHETEVGRIGMGVCYDIMFAEYARVLALKGVDILAYPANWPERKGSYIAAYPDCIVPTRAIENHVFCVAVNRVGEERGTAFFGCSRIVDYFGRPLAQARKGEEDIIYADIDASEARDKHVVVVPGEHEVNVIGDRRPEFYAPLCEAAPPSPM